MFNNMFPENRYCYCTLKEIKVGCHEFSHNQKIVTNGFPWSLTRNRKIVIHGIWDPRTWIWVCAMISDLKKPLWICQLGWNKIWNALLVNLLSPLGAQDKDFGTASQTLLTEVKLHLQCRLAVCRSYNK